MRARANKKRARRGDAWPKGLQSAEWGYNPVVIRGVRSQRRVVV